MTVFQWPKILCQLYRHFVFILLTYYVKIAIFRHPVDARHAKIWRPHVICGCQSTRHMVNSSPGQLVTRSTRHTVTWSTRHPVDSSRSRLVIRSTRHAVDSSQRGGQLVTSKHTSKHQSRTAAAVITLTRSPRSPPLLEKMHKKLSRKQSEQQSLCSVLLHVQ